MNQEFSTNRQRCNKHRVKRPSRPINPTKLAINRVSPFKERMSSRQRINPNLVSRPLTTKRTSSIITRRGSSHVFVRPLPPRVIRGRPSPYISILQPLRVGHRIEPSFQGIKRVQQRFRPHQVRPFRNRVPPLINVVKASTPRVNNRQIRCNGGQLILLPHQIIMYHHQATTIPRNLVIARHVMINFKFINTMVSHHARVIKRGGDLQHNGPTTIPLRTRDQNMTSNSSTQPKEQTLNTSQVNPRVLSTNSNRAISHKHNSVPITMATRVVEAHIFSHGPWCIQPLLHVQVPTTRRRSHNNRGS